MSQPQAKFAKYSSSGIGLIHPQDKICSSASGDLTLQMNPTLEEDLL